MAKDRPADDWPDFTMTARLQSWSLSSDVIEAFANILPELARFPQRPSAFLDVCPVRNDPKRWRLKVAGYRAIYQVRRGHPVIEAFLARTERTYPDFESHRKRI